MSVVKDPNDALRAGVDIVEVTDRVWAKHQANGAERDVIQLESRRADSVGVGDEQTIGGFEKNRRAHVQALDYSDFRAFKFPQRKLAFQPWLPEAGLAMIHGWRGLGKTFLCHGSAYAIALGGSFLRWEALAPKRVLVIDGEMPKEALQARLKLAEGWNDGRLPEPGHLRLAAADMHRDGLPNLAEPSSQQFYADAVADADVVFADNISTLCPGLKENDAESWAPVQAWALSLRRQGKSLVWAHHDGKGGNQRGTSKKEDVLDSVISLKRPLDYMASQGARIEIHFEKARGFYEGDAAPFEAILINGAWIMTEIKAGDDLDALRTMKAQGMTIRDIAERTGLSKSTVQRRLEDEN